MKAAPIIIILAFWGPVIQASALGGGGLNFPDSVKEALARTKNDYAMQTGSSFVQLWGRFAPDQQEMIKRQVYEMGVQRYPARTHLVSYIDALVNAVSIENAAQDVLTAYLETAGKVLANSSPEAALNFFTRSNTFFLHHSLGYGKTYRLYCRDDVYTFDFIGPPVVEEVVYSDTSTSDEWASLDTWQEPPPPPPAMPAWMQPTPQPILAGPVLRFDRVTFELVTAYDSVALADTEGTFSFDDHVFVGNGGVFGWEPAGLARDSVSVSLGEFHMDTNRPDFQAELAMLSYKGKTPGKIPGQFEFKSEARPDSTRSSFPRFKSYQSNLAIANLGGDGMEYRGGFSLKGANILSTDINGTPATLKVSDQSGPRFKARSVEFVFGDSTIEAARASLCIYQGNDSIVHQAVRFKYNFKSRQALVQNDQGGMRNTPYSASFFNMDFSADVIRWDLNTDSLNIFTRGGRSIVPMVLESVDYYDPEDFRLLRGHGFSFHPVGLFANYCIQNDTLVFYSGNLIAATGKDPAEIRMAIEFLSAKGLINYDRTTDRIRVNEKLIRIWKAFRNERDYDNVKIHSVTDTYPNATVNFHDRNMTVRGVDIFRVSDSLNVVIKPDSSVIKILQNRDVKFDGTVTAGNFEITGKEFTLKYDSFFINLKQIDSINFYTLETNARGQTIRKKINNSLVGADSVAAAEGGLTNTGQSAGTLYINMPHNKSGRLNIPNYPRLDATAGGVIYFDRPEILGGVYDRSVFFVVPPFKLDSLNNADPTSMNFEGTFVSSGMFPSFKEKLHTMPDKSLGFRHAIPPPGYQLYKGDGKINGELSLDNKGLRVGGWIDYLAAQAYSSDFVFYPDSVTGSGSKATLSESQFGAVRYPQASLSDYQMKWYPQADEMNFKSRGQPFAFYDGVALLDGKLTVSRSGVKGAGNLETPQSSLVSEEMSFNATEFGGRHADLKVKSGDPAKPLIAGTDVRVRYNLEENSADISPEIEGEAAIEFPYAQFKTSIPNARLDMTTQRVTMSKRPDVPLENSYFYTTRKDLDSLSFYAEKAEYDLGSQQLKVSGIPYIVVADAKITPQNNEVLILENARIGTLSNTTIILDTLNGYHRLTDGVVDIVSRKQFTGYATYQYVNLLRDTFAIKMTNFHLEPVGDALASSKTARRRSLATMQTVATGSVSDRESLVLGAGMFYKGEMTMFATKPALQLKGYVKLDIKSIKGYNTWIRYSQSGDETDIHIDFNTALSEDGKRIGAGLHYKAFDNTLYITFASEKTEEDDDFFLPSGTLHFDNESKEYRIEDLDKASGTKLSGKVFAYNDQTMQVRFEGPVNLFNNNNDFKVTSSAIGQGNLSTEEISMNGFVMINPAIPPEIFNAMALNLQEVIKREGAEEGVGDETELLYKIADIIGERAVKDFEQRSLHGYVSLATLPPTQQPLVFSNVDLKWSDAHKAFYSTGLLGLSNILRNDINAAMEGFMEVRKNDDGSQTLNIFFKASQDDWYYLGYEDSRLLIYSSVPSVNDLVAKRTNAGKAKVGELVFVPGSEEETLGFINRFRMDYFGIEVPYSLYGTRTQKKDTNEKNDGF